MDLVPVMYVKNYGFSHLSSFITNKPSTYATSYEFGPCGRRPSSFFVKFKGIMVFFIFQNEREREREREKQDNRTKRKTDLKLSSGGGGAFVAPWWIVVAMVYSRW